MKYNYKFATGTETIEVDEKWSEILNGFDNEDFNNWQTENRRSESLNDVGPWAKNPHCEIEAMFEEPSFRQTMLSRLPEALEKMKPIQRRIIDLYYFYHKNQMEIASILGINQCNVSRRLATAEKSLKKILQKTA